MPRMVSHKPERKTMKSVTASGGAARAEESDEAQGWAKHSHLLLISKEGRQKPTHGPDGPYRYSWVSPSRYLSAVGQQLRNADHLRLSTVQWGYNYS